MFIYKMHEVTKKILKYKDEHVVVFFYKNTCPYTQLTKTFLEKNSIPSKGYEVINRQEFDIILNKLKDDTQALNFDTNHHTFPIVFYKGKYIGGYDNIINYFQLHRNIEIMNMYNNNICS